MKTVQLRTAIVVAPLLASIGYAQPSNQEIEECVLIAYGKYMTRYNNLHTVHDELAKLCDQINAGPMETNNGQVCNLMNDQYLQTFLENAAWDFYNESIACYC